MRTLITALLLTGSAIAAPLAVTPLTQEVKPGALVILTASELVNWTTTGGTLGSVQGTRIVLEAPKTPGPVTVTITDPKDAKRRAFAVVNVSGPTTTSNATRRSTFAAGEGFSTAIAVDGTVWVWGDNRQGILPASNQKDITVPAQIDALANMNHIQANTKDAYDHGRAGQIISVDGKRNIWRWGGTWGTPNVIEQNADWAGVSDCGYLLKDGILSYMYSNREVLAKDVQFADNKSGYVYFIKNSDSLYQALDCGNQPKIINNGDNILSFSPFVSDSIILIKTSGEGFLNSDNVSKPLAGFTKVAKVSAYKGFGLIIDSAGKVYSFRSDYGNPTIPQPFSNLSDIVDISVSATHMLALRKDGTLFAAGSNQFGQLGNGTTSDSPTFVPVIGLKVKLP